MNAPRLQQIGGYEQAPWLTAAIDPELKTVEERVTTLVDEQAEQWDRHEELGSYYWSGGTPHITFEGESELGNEETRHSFEWDRPNTRTLTSIILRRPVSYSNEKAAEGRVLAHVQGHARIVEQRPGLQYFASDDGYIISPEFDTITPISDERFEVSRDGQTRVLKLLSADEQTKVLEQRAQLEAKQADYDYQELEQLQYRAALGTLALYGIELDPEENKYNPHTGFQIFRFEHADRAVRLDVGRNTLTASCWAKHLSFAKRQELWDAYEHGIQPMHNDLSGERDAFDRAPTDGQSVPGEAEIDSTDMAYHAFLVATHGLLKNNDFRPFRIETPHPSWSIPMAMKITELPFDRAHCIISPVGGVGSRGHLIQDRPGSFRSAHPDSGDINTYPVWSVDDDNTLARIH